jgi:hypothetical protein
VRRKENELKGVAIQPTRGMTLLQLTALHFIAQAPVSLTDLVQA